jgi:transketolase
MLLPAFTANMQEARATAARIRARVVGMSHDAEAPHLGSALSCVDILVATYFYSMRIDPGNVHSPLRDRLIFSKGHAAAALYATLAERGFIATDLLETYGKDESQLAQQPAPWCVPGVEAATGSLGHGLPMGVGHAIASRIQRQQYRVFVVMSDGECNEGSVWEAAMLAPAQRLNHLCVIIDYNRWQATGRSDEVMSLHPLGRKWEAFGWNAIEVDGHNHEQLIDALNRVPFPDIPEGRSLVQSMPSSAVDANDRPLAIIAHTIKGKGVSFMEDDNNWHYRIPTAGEVAAAQRELGAA